MPTELEDRFHEAMLGIYKSAKEHCRYNATRFLEMVIDNGGVKAAKKLLATSDVQYGFTELWECKRLDLTVEALITDNSEYASLFTDEEIEEATRRLDEHDYYKNESVQHCV